MTDRRALDIFEAALKAVAPYDALLPLIPAIEAEIESDSVERTFVLAFGKAACPMVRAVEPLLANRAGAGMAITKYGHLEHGMHYTVPVFEADHPVPDTNGLEATARAMGLVQGLGERDMLICLISGGGSSLLVAPTEGVTLEEKRQATDLLLKSGADINELNAVRKHLSRIKGGRLAELAYPARVRSLIVSDVIGDSLDVIASGPTAPDPTTFSDAWGVMDKHGLPGKAPASVIDVLKRGMEGQLRETPKGAEVFKGVENKIIASSLIALEAAKTKAQSMGLSTEVLAKPVDGDACEAGRRLARLAKEAANKGIQCIISGGETTVRVTGTGKGGRNMELALCFAIEVAGARGIRLLSAGTDGTDGPTDAAGAIVDGDTIPRARSMGLDPMAYLNDNASYDFFLKCDGLLRTGPTGTNVMDVQVMVLG